MLILAARFFLLLLLRHLPQQAIVIKAENLKDISVFGMAYFLHSWEVSNQFVLNRTPYVEVAPAVLIVALNAGPALLTEDAVSLERVLLQAASD